MAETKQHSKNLDEESLTYATELITAQCNKKDKPLDNLQTAIRIMEFGHISLEDMRDWLEVANG